MKDLEKVALDWSREILKKSPIALRFIKAGLNAELDGQAGLGCVGAQVDDLNTDDVTLLSVIIDMSSSMDSVRDAVIDAPTGAR